MPPEVTNTHVKMEYMLWYLRLASYICHSVQSCLSQGFPINPMNAPQYTCLPDPVNPDIFMCQRKTLTGWVNNMLHANYMWSNQMMADTNARIMSNVDALIFSLYGHRSLLSMFAINYILIPVIWVCAFRAICKILRSASLSLEIYCRMVCYGLRELCVTYMFMVYTIGLIIENILRALEPGFISLLLVARNRARRWAYANLPVPRQRR